MLSRPLLFLSASLFVTICAHTLAADPNATGLAPLRREEPSLTGAGVRVGHVEPPDGAQGYFEVNPAIVGQPVSLFTWISSDGTSSTFPNSVGAESGHANAVGNAFYGATNGMAPGLQAVRNYEANYYIQNVITPIASQPDMVVNNSWIIPLTSGVEALFDNYAATRNVIIVSGMNNAYDTPSPPGSAANGIGVGSARGLSSIGPTSDGRAKPDIVVAGDEMTSFITPVVSGAATLLLQAGARNDGGPNTASLATNASTIKALLLNGAVKPVGWTNGTTRPLDARWGAGEVNVYHSWLHLRGGRSAPIATTTVPVNSAHPPTAHPANNATLRGWDYNNLGSTVPNDAVAHYYFDIPANAGPFLANVTLVWKRAVGATSTKNIDLFLYRMANTNLVASSQSTIDNVEHLFVTNLPPGRYNLQVLRRGGALQQGSESYALAWDFVQPRLGIARKGNDLVLSWPVNQAGLLLRQTSSLTAPAFWQYVIAQPFVTNGLNTVTLPATGAASYFQLYRP